MAVNIQLRRGTSAEWTASNPILTEGEVGVETDTKKLKVGDGLTVWASLPYINLTPTAAASIYATIANPTFTGTVSGITKSMVGLGSVDNTTDANKPVSTSTQTALDLKAPLASPTFTGSVSFDTNVALIFEGSTADGFETTLSVADPTADRSLTLPNSTGTLATQEHVASELSTHTSDTTSVHGIADTADLATKGYADNAASTAVSSSLSSLSTHEADTLLVHGIADTAALATKTYADTAVSTHSSDTTDVHGIADTSALATKTYADGAVSTHSSDTTSIHGITDTADLATKTYADTAVSTHSSDTTSVHGIADTANLATKSYADGAVSTHEADTTSVHGIADTSLLVTTTGTQTLTNKTINANANTITVTSANVSDFNEAAQDAIGTILGTGLTYNDSTPGIGIDNAVLTNYLLDGASGNSYGLIGTSAYLDVKNTNGYNKEIELDIAAVKTQLNTDGYLTTSSTSTLTNKTLTSPKINEDVALTATATELNILDGAMLSTTELNYVDGVTSAIQTQLDDKLSKTGGTMTGALTLSGAPTSDLHAATKLYVDNISAGLNFHPAVHFATSTNITTDYNNGTAGLGATLTAMSNGAIGTIDGHQALLGDRALVKAQTDAKQNGIYYVSDAGSAGSKWVLTRALDADNSPTGEIANGDFCFVQNGTLAGGSGFIVSTVGTITIGTTDITYTQFNVGQAVVAGDGLAEATPGTISVASGGITSAMIADGTIVNGDINASAAIDQSKISGLTAALGDKAPLASPTFTGTVTLPAAGIVFSDGTQALEGVPSRTPIIQKTASYTLSALTERDDLIEMGSASAMTLTIPLNSAVAFPVGTSIDILQTSTGQVTIAGDAGVTVNATPGLKLRTTWSSCTLFKRATNTWVVYGDLTA